MSRNNLKIIRVGTRGSPLALRQAGIVISRIKKKFPSIRCRIIIVRTSGDKIRKFGNSRIRKFRADMKGVRIPDYSGKGLFVKEIEEALLSDKIDIAVHSLKDVPQTVAPGLKLAAFLKREDDADVLISRRGGGFDRLPAGAFVGTSSPRRAAQTLLARPDLNIVPIRGNVGTRLEKLYDGTCDALILAAAGLKRIGAYGSIKNRTRLKNFVPAMGQGVICVEARMGNALLEGVLRRSLNDARTEAESAAERSFLRTIGGDCHTPIAARARVLGDKVVLNGLVASPSGKSFIRRSLVSSDPRSAGESLGREFVRLGARRLLCLEKYSPPKRIVLTGLPETNFNIAKKLAGRFDEFIEMPLIRIAPPRDGRKSLKRALGRLSFYDWAVFTSRSSVASVSCAGPEVWRRLKVAAIGEATKDALLLSGVKVAVVPGDESSKGLLKEFSRRKMKGKKVLYLRAEDGLDIVPTGLKKFGAIVESVTAYRTIMVKPVFKKPPADTVFFASPSAVRAFCRFFRRRKGISALCIGETTKREARIRGF